MDLRLYTKSGNDYYFDVSSYDKEAITESVTDSVSRKDILTLEDENGTFTINCKEVECFEIICNDDSEDEECISTDCVGFMIDDEDYVEDEDYIDEIVNQVTDKLRKETKMGFRV